MDNIKFPQNLVLASQSPRRKHLLEQAGFSPRILKIDFEESFPDDLSPEEVAEYLARKKGTASMDFIAKNETCITADTTVILDDKILGKPATKKEAQSMLLSLSERVHKVTTGVCLTNRQSQKSFSVHSTVYCGKLSSNEINFYIDQYKPYDKAALMVYKNGLVGAK